MELATRNFMVMLDIACLCIQGIVASRTRCPLPTANSTENPFRCFDCSYKTHVKLVVSVLQNFTRAAGIAFKSGM
jgi:hypothetical protein